MRLDGKSPFRVLQAVPGGFPGESFHVRPVHGLQEEVVELPMGELLRRGFRLIPDQLEFMTGLLDDGCVLLRGHADPINPVGSLDGAVGLDGNRGANRMQRIDQRGVELQQGLAAGADHERRFTARVGVPDPADPVRGFPGRSEFAAVRSIRAHKIRITELADGVGPVFLASRPQVAPGKSHEYGGATGVESLALERGVDFLDGVGHGGSGADGEDEEPATACGRIGCLRTNISTALQGGRA